MEPVTDKSTVPFVRHSETKSKSSVPPSAGIASPGSTMELDVPLNMRLLTSERQFDALRQEWKAFVQRPEVRATAFQAFEWQRVWWRHFGEPYDLHLVTLRDGDRLVGILPFFLETHKMMGLVPFRRLRLIGSEVPHTIGLFSSYSPSDYLDIIVDPEYAEPAAASIGRYFDRLMEICDQIELNELPESGCFMTYFRPEMVRGGRSFRQEELETCPRIELPDSMDDYLSALDRKARYELRYSKRAVTEKELYRVEKVEEEDHSALEESFVQFVELHQERWNRQGYPGIFADPDFKSFLKEVAREFLDEGYLMFTQAIDNDGNCIAVDFAFDFGGAVYDYQKAFDMESDLSKYSPGKTLLYFLIDDAIASGREAVDLMRGGEKYKTKISNRFGTNWRIVIPDPAGESGFRRMLWNMRRFSTKIQDRIAREILLFIVHYRQWGVKCLSRYASFIRERIAERWSR